MLIKLTFPTDFIEKSKAEIEDPNLSGEDYDDAGIGVQDEPSMRDTLKNESSIKGETVKRQLWK